MKSADKITFSKLVGAGNDFVFLSELSEPLHTQQIQRICNRHFGVGADGVVVLTHVGIGQLKWDFFNQDGSAAQMCGNAARCVVRFAQQTWGWSECELATAAGPVRGRVVDDLVTEVSWAQNTHAPEFKDVSLTSGSIIQGWLVNTGVPHFVIDESRFQLSKDICREIQEHPVFAPEGVNVTFFSQDENGKLSLTRTFERGVRDFTLACGTGVLATARVLHLLGKSFPMQLKAPGGLLGVDKAANGLSLRGPAQWVLTGTFFDGGSHV